MRVGFQQINFAIPAQTAVGTAKVTITGTPSGTLNGAMTIVSVAPGLFSVSGGWAAALYSRYTTDLAPIETNKPIFDPNTAKGVPIPRNPGEQLYLILYGTGIRGHSVAGVTATVGGVSVPVLGAVPTSQFVGEDQINIGPVPASLPSGTQAIVLTVDGKKTNGPGVVLQ